MRRCRPRLGMLAFSPIGNEHAPELVPTEPGRHNAAPDLREEEVPLPIQIEWMT